MAVAIRGPQALYDIATLILARVNDDLGSDAVDRVTVYPGEIVWDQCECGMLAAAVSQTLISDSFPAEVTARTGNCAGGTFVGSIVVGIVRCSPSPPDDDIAPLTDELNAAAALSASDQWHLLTSVNCILAEMSDDYRIMDALVGRATTVDRGGCMGSQLTAQVQINRGVNV